MKKGPAPPRGGPNFRRVLRCQARAFKQYRSRLGAGIVARCGWIARDGHQQHGGSGDQKIAGGSDPERRIDAEGNAGNNGNARSENAGRAVDAPEPWRGARADRGDESHAGRKSKAHQEAGRRQDKNTKAGANEKVRAVEVDQERQPERQRKQVGGSRHAPGDEHAGSGKVHALGRHAAEACPEDQAEQNDTERIDGMTEEHAHSLQESDLDHHEAHPDQSEIDGAAHGQRPAGFFDRRPQGYNDRRGDERDRNQNEHGEGQRRDEVAGEHSGVRETREYVRRPIAWRTATG